MPSIPGYTLESLADLTQDGLRDFYDGLVYPPLGHRPELPRLQEPWVGAAMCSVEEVVGLVVVQLPRRPGDAAEVVSLYVQVAHRGHGLGHDLLAHAEELARQAGARVIEASYGTTWRSRQAIEALLASRAWAPAVTRSLLARSTNESARGLLDAPSPLPEGVEIVPWVEITEVDRATLEAICREPGFPHEASPFQDPGRLERRISVVARWHGEAAGWLTVHRVVFDTVQYSSTYVRPRARGHRLYWAMVREAARRRLADPALHGAILSIAPANHTMRSLLDGPLSPHLSSRSELRVGRKVLVGKDGEING